MGNCLKRVGSSQQDNTTLLSNNPDPMLTSGSSQEGLGPPIPYNVISFFLFVSLLVPSLKYSLIVDNSSPLDFLYFILFL